MDIFDQILENLELERDLGTRTVEMDRALLVPPAPEPVPVKEAFAEARSAVPERPAPVPARPAPQPASVQQSAPTIRPEPVPQSAPAAAACDIAFFTGRPLSPAGMEAMEKIFAAIGKMKPAASVCMNEDRKAKVCVLLGSDALQKRNPAARPIRGAWTSVDGVPAIMTFSPDYIFSHFQEGSPRMKDAKLVMWNDIKSVVARLG